MSSGRAKKLPVMISVKQNNLASEAAHHITMNENLELTRTTHSELAEAMISRSSQKNADSDCLICKSAKYFNILKIISSFFYHLQKLNSNSNCI